MLTDTAIDLTHTSPDKSGVLQIDYVSARPDADRVLRLIEHGWAVIGRPDKLLSPASLEVLQVKPDELLVRLHEPGEWLVWLADGRPEVAGGQVTERGNGLGTPAT